MSRREDGARIEKRGKYVLEYFTPLQQELNKELLNHPKLREILNAQVHADFEVRLAEIAAYCDIALDDEYTAQDLNFICKLCLQKLKEKSTILILPSSLN